MKNGDADVVKSSKYTAEAAKNTDTDQTRGYNAKYRE